MEQSKQRAIKKVVLVAPPIRPEQVWGKQTAGGEVTPPLGLCYIAAYIRQSGYQVSILDAEVLHYDLAQTVQHIVDEKPDLVGFTCKTLWVTSAHRVAQALKERRPDVPIVAGGHHPTAIPERTLSEFPCFDILVLGEGEITFLELLQALNSGQDLSQVKGLAFQVEGQPYFTPPRERIKNLDELPKPALDLIPPLGSHYPASTLYAIKGASFPLMTSRGCPGQCTFCDRSVFGNRVTFHSPDYIMALVESLYRQQVRYLLISDDNFLLKRSHLYALLEAFQSSGLKLKFSCQSRVDTIDAEKTRRLKEAGCQQIIFGIESGSQLILDKMKKGITVEQIKKAVSLTKQAGIVTGGFFITGFPGETEKTLQETADLIYECQFDDVMCFFYAPLPGSAAYPDIAQYGVYQEDFEKQNTMEPLFIPEGTTIEMLKDYAVKQYNACYLRGYQLRSIPRRVPTLRHFKALMKSFSSGV